GALRKEDERMVIGAMPREVADRGADARALVFRQALREIERVGDAKAEQPAVEVAATLGVRDIHAEVAESPDAERARPAHAPEIELGLHAPYCIAARTYSSRRRRRRSPRRRCRRAGQPGRGSSCHSASSRRTPRSGG